ncbi:MAG: hypothetical protein AAF862_02430 [Pseudomonadota bacterium]
MTSLLWFAIASLMSIGACLALRFIDPKRRRLVKQKPPELPGFVRPGLWSMFFLPAIALLFASQYVAFLAWLGAISVLGWLIALQPPKQAE